MLNDFKLVRWRELAIFDFLLVDFVFESLIDSLWRQGLTKLPLMPRLATPLAFLPCTGSLLDWRFDNIA